ncbi:caspase family protein [Streptomyces sp. NPDC046876]|uniref:caspase family protein n=1 Tax=Streptomyces sp. NPDC046876 TaxID=3155616 RepID=UPI0034103F2B
MNDSRYALIIANDDYENPGLRKLVSPAADALALARVLSDPKIGNFDVQVAQNQPSYVIARKIDDFFDDRKPGDALIVHFSCHGLKSESGQLFFAGIDTVPGKASTAVSADFVRDRVSSSRAQSIVLFLDCCYGGAFSPGMTVRAGEDVHVLEAFSSEKLGGGRGWAVITASNSMEYAFEGTQLSGEFDTPQPSVFTGALVNGLTTGEADRDEDGLVSLNELYDYVYEQVRQKNPRQTPSRTINLQGDLYVAHSGRKRIKPAKLPPDLQEAISSPNVFTRRGAITELRFRMTSTDLENAVGARQALVEMSNTEIQWVADEAAAALREVALSPDPSTLDFGTLTEGSPSPRKEVRLPGPPLARQCEASSEDDRISVQKTADGLEISVDTSRAGQLSGDILLKGAAGEATLQVSGEITPKRAERPHAAQKTVTPPPRQDAMEQPLLQQPRRPSPRTPLQPKARQTPLHPRAKRALVLSGCALAAEVAALVCLVASFTSALYVQSDIATEADKGVAFEKAVQITMSNVVIMGGNALASIFAALAAIALGRIARHDFAAASAAAGAVKRTAHPGIDRVRKVLLPATVMLAHITFPLALLLLGAYVYCLAAQ